MDFAISSTKIICLKKYADLLQGEFLRVGRKLSPTVPTNIGNGYDVIVGLKVIGPFLFISIELLSLRSFHNKLAARVHTLGCAVIDFRLQTWLTFSNAIDFPWNIFNFIVSQGHLCEV